MLFLEVILFKNKRKTKLSKLNLKLCRKKLHPIESARYLGVIVDENLNWKKHVNDIWHKLIRGNVILSKIRTKVLQGLFILQSFTAMLIMSLLHGGILITHNREYLFSRRKLYGLCTLFSSILIHHLCSIKVYWYYLYWKLCLHK